MRPSEVTTTLSALIPTQRPLFLWGPPGVGKSALVRNAAKALGLSLIDVRAVLLDPVDLRGLPAIVDGKAIWCTPDFLPQDGNGVLFLDELAQAPPLVQSACLQLTLDRRIGEYELPPGWSIVAASNRQEDRAGAHRLISPLLNRFIHVDCEVHNDDWQDWAIGAGICSEVRSFLKFRPSLLHSFNANDGQRSFPSPRTWEFVSQVLDKTPESLWQPVVAGCVGVGPAAEFVAFLRLYRDLPDMAEVVKDPANYPIPTEPSVLYATAGALVDRVRKGGNPAADASAAGIYATRMPPEFTTLLLRDLIVVHPQVISTPVVKAWFSKNAGLFAK